MNNILQVTRLIKSGLIHISPAILAFTDNHRIKYKGGGKTHRECGGEEK